MNLTQINKLGARPIVDLLESLGSWPLLNPNWNEQEWNVEQTLAAIHRNVSVFPLFKVSVNNDARNVSSSYRLAVRL
jgi:hypothetical protein